MSKPLVLALVGPTASGKSSLALAAAQASGGEIVCMDSMQVYRGMDIGTAKPGPAEQGLVPHHMMDVINPEDSYSVAEYRAGAVAAIDDILARGRLPILCGGTGLYFRALSQPMSLGRAQADPEIRERYQRMAREKGNQAVHSLLIEKDPQSALSLHPNNLRRVIRALEVLELTGKPFSEQRMPGPDEGPYEIRPYALDWPRQTLYRRISQRFGQMLEEGLLKEVQALLDRGVSPEAQSMQGLGYKELVPHLRGQTSLAEARELAERRTRNYAKRQLTWFRADRRITWLPGEHPMEEHIQAIKREGIW